MERVLSIAGVGRRLQTKGVTRGWRRRVSDFRSPPVRLVSRAVAVGNDHDRSPSMFQAVQDDRRDDDGRVLMMMMMMADNERQCGGRRATGNGRQAVEGEAVPRLGEYTSGEASVVFFLFISPASTAGDAGQPNSPKEVQRVAAYGRPF
jgi:hypothetical protein